MPRRLTLALLALGAGRCAYRLLTSGALTLDTGLQRRVRPLGPASWRIAAPRETVFDVIATPYLGRTTRAIREKIDVWERGTDMVLAAHHTSLERGITTTVETVRFDRPERIDFRLVRGPVPHVRESFLLSDLEGETELTWQGELGTDFGALGARWGDIVARAWEHAVRGSMNAIVAESERRAARDRG